MPLRPSCRASYGSRHPSHPGESPILSWVLVFLSLIASLPAWALSTSQEINQEATAPNSETNHPLPLMGSWAAGEQWDTGNLGYTPAWQMQMIAQGHHLLPWFDIPLPNENSNSADWLAWLTYYQSAIQQAAQLNLPITFV